MDIAFRRSPSSRGACGDVEGEMAAPFPDVALRCTSHMQLSFSTWSFKDIILIKFDLFIKVYLQLSFSTCSFKDIILIKFDYLLMFIYLFMFILGG